MNTTLRGRIRDRALATDLLRDLTILTAVAGLAATAGFGWLASMTFAGTPSANASVSDGTTTDDQLAAPTPRTTAPNAAATRMRPRRRVRRRRRPRAGRRVAHLRRVFRLPGGALTSRPAAPDRMLEHANWRALGTNAHLFVLDGDLAAVRARVDRVLDDVDSAYSRFRRDSELMRLQAAAGQWTPVSQLLWDALSVALRAARDTDGAVDPTIGRAMRIVGYDDDFANVARRGAAADRPLIHVELAPVPGWRAIGLDTRTPIGPRAGRCGARPRLDRKGAGFGPRCSRRVCRRTRWWRPRESRRRYRDRRPVARGWLAGILASEDSETPAESVGEVIAIEGRSRRDLEHDRATVAVRGRHRPAPLDRSVDGRSRRQSVADGLSRRRHVCRGELGRDRDDRARRRWPPLAGSSRPTGTTRGRGRAGDADRRLA